MNPSVWSGPQPRVLAVSDLRLGMFVSRLDRPWAGTPFSPGGFVIREARELASLRELCRVVCVEPARSSEVSFPPLPAGARQGRRMPPPEVAALLARADADFGGFLRDLDAGFLPALAVATAAAAHLAQALAAASEEVTLELELLASQDCFEHACRQIALLGAALRGGRRAAWRSAERVVGELAESMARNADALMWRTHPALMQVGAPLRCCRLLAVALALPVPAAERARFGLAGLLLDAAPGALHGSEPLALAATRGRAALRLLAASGDAPPGLAALLAWAEQGEIGTHGAGGAQGEWLDCCALHVAVQAGMVEAEMLGLSSCDCQAHVDEMRVPQLPAVLSACQGALGVFPVGALVELDSGEQAVVVAQHGLRRMLPRLLCLRAATGGAYRPPRPLDLLTSLAPGGAREVRRCLARDLGAQALLQAASLDLR